MPIQQRRVQRYTRDLLIESNLKGREGVKSLQGVWTGAACYIASRPTIAEKPFNNISPAKETQMKQSIVYDQKRFIESEKKKN